MSNHDVYACWIWRMMTSLSSSYTSLRIWIIDTKGWLIYTIWRKLKYTVYVFYVLSQIANIQYCLFGVMFFSTLYMNWLIMKNNTAINRSPNLDTVIYHSVDNPLSSCIDYFTMLTAKTTFTCFLPRMNYNVFIIIRTIFI